MPFSVARDFAPAPAAAASFPLFMPFQRPAFQWLFRGFSETFQRRSPSRGQARKMLIILQFELSTGAASALVASHLPLPANKSNCAICCPCLRRSSVSREVSLRVSQSASQPVVASKCHHEPDGRRRGPRVIVSISYCITFSLASHQKDFDF